MKTYYNTNEIGTSTDYPYGWKKTTATFALEHKKGKGFRTVFQTINPKTGRINKPKKSTYSPVLLMHKNEEGHFKYSQASFYGVKGINDSCEFMAKNYAHFQPSEITDILNHLLMKLKVEIISTVQYCGADIEAVKALITPAFKKVVQGIKEQKNIFGEIKLDLEALKATHIKNYNPFVSTTHQIIGG